MNPLNIAKLILGILSFVLVTMVLFLESTFAILFLVLAVYALSIITIVDGAIERKFRPEPVNQVMPQQMVQQPQMVQQGGSPFDMTPKPKPAPKPKPVFSCRFCEKTFETETKLRRHMGMSHYDKLEI